MKTEATAPTNIHALKSSISTSRLDSVDCLRGIVIILMALDHVREFLHYDSFYFAPTDIQQTNPAIFFTRWITHFCAPVFIFLAGVSASLMRRRMEKGRVAKFLLQRGIFLIILELTVINFAWYFNPFFTTINFIVIWVIGISMIMLAGMIYLPRTFILIFSLVLILFHNLLDLPLLTSTLPTGLLWTFLHELKFISYHSINIFVAYPIIPWLAVMSLGYYMGGFLNNIPNEQGHVKGDLFFKVAGWVCVIGFLILRWINVYGDPHPWVAQESTTYTILSFLNVYKYPPSLSYLLATLGPAFLFLGYIKNIKGIAGKICITFGRTPLFFYIIHLYIIHFIALCAAPTQGFSWKLMILDTWIKFKPELKGFGYNLSIVYIIWLAVLLLCFFLCRWFLKYKSKKNFWLLQYF